MRWLGSSGVPIEVQITDLSRDKVILSPEEPLSPIADINHPPTPGACIWLEIVQKVTVERVHIYDLPAVNY